MCAEQQQIQIQMQIQASGFTALFPTQLMQLHHWLKSVIRCVSECSEIYPHLQFTKSHKNPNQHVGLQE